MFLVFIIEQSIHKVRYNDNCLGEFVSAKVFMFTTMWFLKSEQLFGIVRLQGNISEMSQ